MTPSRGHSGWCEGQSCSSAPCKGISWGRSGRRRDVWLPGGSQRLRWAYARAREIAGPRDPLFGTRLLVCAKNWVLRPSSSLNGHEGPSTGCSACENSTLATTCLASSLSWLTLGAPENSVRNYLISMPVVT